MTGQPDQAQIERLDKLRRAYDALLHTPEAEGYQAWTLAQELLKVALALAARLRQADQERWSERGIMLDLQTRAEDAEERARQAEQIIEAARLYPYDIPLPVKQALAAYDVAKEAG
jgi:hypothetical protein